jgi:hypothetical protein
MKSESTSSFFFLSAFLCKKKDGHNILMNRLGTFPAGLRLINARRKRVRIFLPRVSSATWLLKQLAGEN